LHKSTDWKNDSKILGWGTLIVFALIVFLIERNLRIEDANIKKNRKIAEAITIDCFKNVKSSMHNVRFQFYYNGQVYSGSEKFDKGKRGDICKGFYFLVEFDSLDPLNNRIMLDSIVK
jgi:archaellum component FlaF (FlaF/FlaG flagellin family)